VLNEGAVHVFLTSAQDNISIQRNLTCSVNGKVELYVHNHPVDVNRFLKKAPASVPLTSNTVNKFVDRIVKIVEQVNAMEVCGGCDSENLKAGWSKCTLREVDGNPFNECRYSETFRSFSCKRFISLNLQSNTEYV